MTRFINSLCCIVFASLIFPGMAFSGGKSDPAAKNQGAASGNETETPMATSIKDLEVATVQIAPSVPRETIFLGQLKSEIARAERVTGRALTADEKRQVLDMMINEKLAIQAATRDKITVSDSEINQQIQQLKDSMVQVIGRAPTEIEFALAIRNETGIDAPAHLQTDDEKKNFIIDAFRDQIRRQALVQRYLGSKKENEFKSIKMPTDTEITDVYNLRKSEFVRPDTVRFSMIQVPFGPDDLSKAKAKELADRLVREIGSNASRFDEAVSRGRTPNSGYQAGDGGFLPRNAETQQVVGDEFFKAAFALKQGEVSKLIESAGAYRIIKITESYELKNLALDDIYQLGTSMTVRNFIGNAMLQERQQTTLAQASQELITELRAGNTYRVFEQNLNW